MTQSTLPMPFAVLIPILPETVGCEAPGAGHISGSLPPPPPPPLPVSHTPDVRFARLQEGVKSIPRFVFSPPSLSPPFATRKSSALYSEQKEEGGGS